MIVLKFLGMCLLDFVIGKVFDAIGECAADVMPMTFNSVPKLGAPFVGALR